MKMNVEHVAWVHRVVADALADCAQIKDTANRVEARLKAIHRYFEGVLLENKNQEEKREDKDDDAEIEELTKAITEILGKISEAFRALR